MKVGDIVDGVVTYVGTKAFTVTVGDYSGLLFKRDYDWVWDSQSVGEIILGQMIKAVVTKVFENDRQMNLSAKQLKPDPFVISADKIIDEGYLISHRLPKRNGGWSAILNGGEVDLVLKSGFTVRVYLKDSLIPVDELIVGDEYMFYAKSIDYEHRSIRLQLVGKI